MSSLGANANAIGVIPARYGSSRFPGKPLALVAGKPLLQWVIEGSRACRSLREVFVATDDDRIAELARSCGARVVMTDSQLPTGTDRVWAAAREIDCDVVVNIQGDEPLIESTVLEALLKPFSKDSSLEMATLGRRLDLEALHSPNTAKIVLNARGEAIYFSRFPIPFSRVQPGDAPGMAVSCALKHIGIYAYRRSFLERFCGQRVTEIETHEGLEQLRALYLGARIHVVQVEHDSWGVDTPDDVQKIEKMIRERRGKQG